MLETISLTSKSLKDRVREQKERAEREQREWESESKSKCCAGLVRDISAFKDRPLAVYTRVVRRMMEPDNSYTKVRPKTTLAAARIIFGGGAMAIGEEIISRSKRLFQTPQEMIPQRVPA